MDISNSLIKHQDNNLNIDKTQKIKMGGAHSFLNVDHSKHTFT